MKTMKAGKCATLLLIVLAAASTGCATRDRRDAPWDPDQRKGQTLFDQMPNWDDAAAKICCGHLKTCKANQSPRC
jgi:hypothetical protein